MKFIKDENRNLKICPICKKHAEIFINKSDYQVYKCKNCNFGFTIGADVQHEDYHRDDVYLQEEELFKNIFNRRVKTILEVIKSGDVLEVGCSTGLLLSLLREKGFNVTGLEISHKSAEKSRQRGIKVISDPIQTAKFDQKFDLVIMNHTLEHLEDFRKVLEKINKILKPKGYLFIDLPNFDSYSANFQKNKWPLLLPKEHLWHFSEKAFRIIFKELNFKVIGFKKVSGIWDFGNPTIEVINSLFKLKKRFFSEILTAIPTYFISKVGKGSDLTVIARKK